MWVFVCLLAVQAFANGVDGVNDLTEGAVSAGNAAPNPIDQELAQMSQQLDEQPAQAQKVEEKIAESPNVDVKRYVELEPNEEIALVQYNVPAQIISTRPGDKVAIIPVGGKQTTPCPTTTSKSEQPHMYCQSCGKVNPKERGLITSYIDVASPRECASLCARYLSKGKKCDVWEYHGEWRNKQCFLLCIPDFKKCSGDIGLLGEFSFESGTCDRQVSDSEQTESLSLEALDMDSGLPDWFPRAESSVASKFEVNSNTSKLFVGAVVVSIFGAVLYRRTKRPADGYAELLNNQDEI